MNVFVSSNRTQGDRKNDFCWTHSLELLRMGVQCRGEAIDGKCGCRRSLVGVDSMKSTTTFVVVDLPITIVDYEKRIYDSLMKAQMQNIFGLEATRERAHKTSGILLKAASQFQPGDIVERRGDRFQTRMVREEEKP